MRLRCIWKNPAISKRAGRLHAEKIMPIAISAAYASLSDWVVLASESQLAAVYRLFPHRSHHKKGWQCRERATGPSVEKVESTGRKPSMLVLCLGVYTEQY